MRDIGERPAVHERRGALQRLHQVGLHGVLQQHRHRAVSLQVGGGDTAAVARSAPTIILPSRASRSSSELRDRQNTAITSEATVMSNPSSRGKPLATPPGEATIPRSARSFMSRQRRQVIRRASMPSALPQ